MRRDWAPLRFNSRVLEEALARLLPNILRDTYRQTLPYPLHGVSLFCAALDDAFDPTFHDAHPAYAHLRALLDFMTLRALASFKARLPLLHRFELLALQPLFPVPLSPNLREVFLTDADKSHPILAPWPRGVTLCTAHMVVLDSDSDASPSSRACVASTHTSHGLREPPRCPRLPNFANVFFFHTPVPMLWLCGACPGSYPCVPPSRPRISHSSSYAFPSRFSQSSTCALLAVARRHEFTDARLRSLPCRCEISEETKTRTCSTAAVLHFDGPSDLAWTPLVQVWRG
ncbi:hypothetical protein B0H13DRAFT_2673752 [Mycena leptocephala]|nr:hypothetical protein B0H13DRAFT_2673752 [Mycena leptocephala]